jgi:hypothetical protein
MVVQWLIEHTMGYRTYEIKDHIQEYQNTPLQNINQTSTYIWAETRVYLNQMNIVLVSLSVKSLGEFMAQ